MNVRNYITTLNINRKILFAFILLALLVFLFYNFSIAPFLERQKKLKLSLLSQKKLLEARLASVEKIDSMESEIVKLQKTLADLNDKFLTRDKLPTFFTSIRNLAEENGVTVLSMQISEKIPEKSQIKSEISKYEEVPVNISLSGTCYDMMFFLGKLRQESTLFSISRMIVKPADKKTQTVHTYLQVNLYVAYDRDV